MTEDCPICEGTGDGAYLWIGGGDDTHSVIPCRACEGTGKTPKQEE